jgi:serpin B
VNQSGVFRAVSSAASILAGHLFQSADNGNSVFSPFGIFVLLSALSEGAAGATAGALRSFLGINSPESFRGEMNRFLSFPSRRASESLLSLANLILIKDSFQVSDDFLGTVRGDYRFFADCAAFDKETLLKINRWASENTDGRITEVLRVLMPDEVMVMVNSILFAGQWETPFRNGETCPGDFIYPDGSRARVDMMRLRDEMEYCQNTAYRAVRLKYTGGRFSMSFLVPSQGVSGDEIFPAVLGEGIPFPKTVSFGEFLTPRVSVSNEINADQILKKSGLELLFSRDADLTGINPAGMLNVNRIVQRNTLSVDEAGTMAASVTAAAVSFRGIPRIPEFSLVCDRTYYLILNDDVFGIPLIAARITRP